MEKPVDGQLIIEEDPKVSLLEISMDNEAIVTIEADGTVIIHKEGGDKEAAKKFYESLEFEGKTLYKKIADLEAEIKELKENNQVTDPELIKHMVIEEDR